MPDLSGIVWNNKSEINLRKHATNSTSHTDLTLTDLNTDEEQNLLRCVVTYITDT